MPEQHPSFCRLLLTFKANPNVQDNYKMTPLRYAISSQNPVLVNMLAPFSDLSDRDSQKNAYIHYAAMKNNYDVFSTILAEYQARKADLNVRMELKELEYTPLLIALSLKEKVDERIPESLIDAGVDISLKFPNGKSPIFRASEENLLSVVKKLIEKGANILDVYEDEEEGIPYTSFYYSVLSHHNELSHLFLDCYAKFLQTQSDKN